MDLELVLDQILANAKSIALLAALLVFGIALTLYRTTTSFGKIKSSQPTILIAGPSGSGKTSLYTLWTSGKVTDTVTSQESNTYTSFSIPFDSDFDATKITLVDLPGHPKLNHVFSEALESYSNIKGIVYVIDAASGPKGIQEAANRLFNMLLKTETRMGGIDIMIACNKADVFNMIPSARLQTMLEEEIQNIRDNRSKSLGEVGAAGSLDDDNEDDGSWLGGSKFKFINLEGEVSIADGSVLLNNVENWKRFVEAVTVN